VEQNEQHVANSYSQEEVSRAEEVEQQGLDRMQMQYLRNRVVVLRAELNRMSAAYDQVSVELRRFREQYEPELPIGEEPPAE
jgi:hypothetical protein